MTTAPPSPSRAERTGAETGISDAETGISDGRTPAAGRPAGRLRYLVAALVVAGALGFLLAKGLGTSLNFYLPADQAVRQAASLGGRTFNLEGVVQAGSVRTTASGVDFVVTSGPTAVRVVNTGNPPELFQADIPVIAVGHFSGSTFVSDQILVKHSSDYVAAHRGRVTAPDGSTR